MNPSDQTQIENALKEACRTFLFSGYQLAVEYAQKTTVFAGGMTSYWPSAKPVTELTCFDLGSLTKVIATTSIFARLYERAELKLTTSLGEIWSSLKGTRFAPITLIQLLSHSSGLIAWHPFYQESDLELIDVFLRNEKVFLKPATEEKKTIYSDLGFLLLGEVLKQKFGPIQKLFEEEVVGPLKLKGIKFGPLQAEHCAATEFCLERKRLLQGEVFDLNTAHFGNVCSHAGLFSNANHLIPWAREWLKAAAGESDWLSETTARSFISAGQGTKESTWGLGWDTKSKAFSSAGDFFSMRSFGHLGYPGTSLWIDPEKKGIAILLTNRVHPSRYDERIKRFRPAIHDLVAKSWERYGS